MSALERSIVIRPRISLDNNQRAQYKEAIEPYVLAARIAYVPLLEVREQKKVLDGEQQRIEEQIAGSQNSRQGRHPLSAALAGIKIARSELDHSLDSSGATEEFRLIANELIVEVNNLRTSFATESNLLNPGATALIDIPQISPQERRDKFLSPNSPIRPHNALGTLSIYRPRQIRPDLAQAIRVQTNLSRGIVDVTDVSLAMTHLLPEHFVIASRSTPTDLKKPADLGQRIVDLSNLVVMYESERLVPPTAEELGSRSGEQDQHIETHLRALLAHFLREELRSPNRAERQIQDMYQELSNFIRATAKHITPQGIHVNFSYDRIGLIIENLPGIEGPMLAARLSTNLYQDLGLPCLDYIGELRMAEVLRNIANSGHYAAFRRDSIQVEGFVLPESRRLLLIKIMDSISERLENDELDCKKLFGSLESVRYGEQIIKQLFDVSDDEQQDVLLRALIDSSCFEDTIGDLIRKKHTSPYDAYNDDDNDYLDNEDLDTEGELR